MDFFSAETLASVLTVLEGVGVLAFASSGVLVAARKRLDLVGVVIVAFSTSLGGGTIRDVLLGREPFFWVSNQGWVWAVIAISVLGPVFLRSRHIAPTLRAMQWPDAVGLGLFAASGTHIALMEGHTPLVASMMGVVTATFGGILRDVLVNEVPWVVNSYQLYAVLAFLGGLLVWALVELGVGSVFAVSIAALAIMATRMLSMVFDWRLPGWRLGPQTEAIPIIRD